MDQQQTFSGDCESHASEPKDQKPTLTCAGPAHTDDANMDDVCSSSTSSTTTENADVRPTVALSAEASPLTEVASNTDVSRRISARCKRDEVEPTDRKLLPRRSKSKKSQKDSTSASSAVNAQVPDLSLEPTPSQVATGENLHSSPSLLLPVKQDPCCESSIIPDSGDTGSRTSLLGGDEDSFVDDGTSSRPPMSLMEADAYSYHTESGIMDKVCAFCCRGEKSLLGQGELTCYDPTPGFNPFKRQLSRVGAKRALSETEEMTGKRGQQSLTWRRTRGPLRQQSSLGSEKTKPVLPQRANSQPALDFDGRPLPTVDELSLVGYPDDVEVSQLFEKSGQVCAHHCCAAWSEGVIQTDDYSLRFVDKAVFAGLTQKCSYCMCYGATISCRYNRCSRRYHYPCASGSGCFQDIKTMSLLCPDHTDEAVAIANQEACCVVCDLPGNISDQLFCTSCGQHYHGNCLDPAVEVNPIVRAGWQCPECKICQTCRQPGDDNKMLVCDTCDKGYHTFCLKPVMTTIPKNGWKCKNCRICGDCGSRTPGSGPSSRWHLNYSVCDSCYQQRNKGLCCPVCCKAYRHFTQSKMLPCSQCKRCASVHHDHVAKSHT